MPHDFHDTYVSREKQFSVGIDRATGKYYVSFLEVTSNRRSEFEVFFQLPTSHLACAVANPDQLEEFVDQCRQGRHANLRIDP